MAGPWRASEAAAPPGKSGPAFPLVATGGSAGRRPASRGSAARRKPRGRPETALKGLGRGGVVSGGLPAPFQRNSNACSARQGHSTDQAGSCAPRRGIRAFHFRPAPPTATAHLAVDLWRPRTCAGHAGWRQRMQGPDRRWVTRQSSDIRASLTGQRRPRVADRATMPTERFALATHDVSHADVIAALPAQAAHAPDAHTSWPRGGLAPACRGLAISRASNRRAAGSNPRKRPGG
jgi:hypothetical protein